MFLKRWLWANCAKTVAVFSVYAHFSLQHILTWVSWSECLWNLRNVTVLLHSHINFKTGVLPHRVAFIAYVFSSIFSSSIPILLFIDRKLGNRSVRFFSFFADYVVGHFCVEARRGSDHLVVKTSHRNYKLVWCFTCTCLVSNMFSLLCWPVEMGRTLFIRYQSLWLNKSALERNIVQSHSRILFGYTKATQ